MTTKIHQVVDGHGRPLSTVVPGSQRNDGAMMQSALEDLYVPRPVGCPHTSPDVVMADPGYATGANRRYLSDRHIKAIIPKKVNEIGFRKKKAPREDAHHSSSLGPTRVETSWNAPSQQRPRPSPWPCSPSDTAPLSPAKPDPRKHRKSQHLRQSNQAMSTRAESRASRRVIVEGMYSFTILSCCARATLARRERCWCRSRPLLRSWQFGGQTTALRRSMP